MDTLEAESTVTSRGQTTVPASFRKLLNVTDDANKLHWRTLQDGSVVVSKLEGLGDPLITEFLNFIEADARNNFASLRPLTPEWLAGLQQLVKGVKIDLNAPLNPDDE